MAEWKNRILCYSTADETVGNTIGGLQSPQSVDLNTERNGSTVSNIDVGQDAARSDIVYVYGNQVNEFEHKENNLFTGQTYAQSSHIRNVMSQANAWDCGVLALAIATELVYGYDPARCHWEAGRMR